MFEIAEIEEWIKASVPEFKGHFEKQKGEHFLYLRQDEKSDYDVRFAINRASCSISAELRHIEGKNQLWEMKFSEEDYRDKDLFQKHLVKTIRVFLKSPTQIKIKKGLLFLRFECFYQDGEKWEKLFDYGCFRYFFEGPEINKLDDVYAAKPFSLRGE